MTTERDTFSPDERARRDLLARKPKAYLLEYLAALMSSLGIRVREDDTDPARMLRPALAVKIVLLERYQTAPPPPTVETVPLPRTAAATAAVMRKAEERKAAELRARGWTCIPPEERNQRPQAFGAPAAPEPAR